MKKELVVQVVLYKYIKMKTKVFLSGGMNTSNWQKTVIEQTDKNGFIFFNPREHKLENSKEYTIWDLHYVKECDFVFAYMQEDNPSGYGLTLEVGYAAALGKGIILIDERSNVDDKFQQYFKIVREASTIIFDNLTDGIKFLKNIRNGIITL